MSGDGWLSNATISAILGGLSGGVVSWLIALGSERATRRYSQYCAIESLLDELHCISIRYWKKPGKDCEVEAAIKGLVEKLDLKVQSLSRLIGKGRVARGSCDRVDDLAEEITGDDFEMVSRKRNSVRALKIENQLKELKDYLHGYV